jgi:ADP-heptose:LPS heptosyltransferase
MAFGARQAAGYYLPGQYQPDEATFFPYPQGEHEIRIFLRLMESLGIPTQGEALEFPVLEAEHAEYRALLRKHGLEAGSYFCLHPGARAEGRRLPPQTFAALGDWLSESGLRVVLTGSKAEEPITRAVGERMQRKPLDLTGQTSLGALALLIAGARLLVSNDTGVSHVAAAVQAPSVVFFTGSDPNRWRPLHEGLHRAVTGAARRSIDELRAITAEALSTAPDPSQKAKGYAQESV